MPEWLNLIIGALVGLAVALLLQPLLEDPARSLLVRLVGRFNIVRARQGLDGDWMFVWWKDGADPGRELETPVRLRTVGKRVAGKFEWKERTYQLIASRHTDEFVSGTYVDARDGHLLHGAFQLQVFLGDEQMAGRWMGFRQDRSIAEGPWYLRRVTRDKYSYEEYPDPDPGS